MLGFTGPDTSHPPQLAAAQWKGVSTVTLLGVAFLPQGILGVIECLNDLGLEDNL